MQHDPTLAALGITKDDTLAAVYVPNKGGTGKAAPLKVRHGMAAAVVLDSAVVIVMMLRL